MLFRDSWRALPFNCFACSALARTQPLWTMRNACITSVILLSSRRLAPFRPSAIVLNPLRAPANDCLAVGAPLDCPFPTLLSGRRSLE
jgi:hypothetical protein